MQLWHAVLAVIASTIWEKYVLCLGKESVDSTYSASEVRSCHTCSPNNLHPEHVGITALGSNRKGGQEPQGRDRATGICEPIQFGVLCGFF